MDTPKKTKKKMPSRMSERIAEQKHNHKNPNTMKPENPPMKIIDALLIKLSKHTKVWTILQMKSAITLTNQGVSVRQVARQINGKKSTVDSFIGQYKNELKLLEAQNKTIKSKDSEDFHTRIYSEIKDLSNQIKKEIPQKDNCDAIPVPISIPKENLISAEVIILGVIGVVIVIVLVFIFLKGKKK